MAFGEQAQCDILDLDRQLQPVRLVLHALGDLAQRRGARVVGAVDPMAETHQALAAIERIVEPLLGVLDRADLRKLVDDLGRRTAVERALHRPDRGDDGRRDIRVRPDHDACGERRGVESVLGADDEVGVEGPGGRRFGWPARELVEKAFDEIERRIGVNRLLALADPGERRERRGRERGQRASLLDGRRVRQCLCGAPRGDGRPERIHRLRRHRQCAEGGHDRVANGPRRQSRTWIPVAGPEEVCHGRIGAMLDEIADPVAAIRQPPLGTVDLRERGLAGQDALEPGRVGAVVGRGGCLGARWRARVRHRVDGSPRRIGPPSAGRCRWCQRRRSFGLSASRMTRTTIAPMTATIVAAMKPGPRSNPSWAASQPPTIAPRTPTTTLGRQPRAVRPPTTAPDRAPAMNPMMIQ